jgi:hypothetical protein
MKQEVSVHHWRYDDGWHDIPRLLLKDKTKPAREFNKDLVGWSCWVFCQNHREFLDWMSEHCYTAECVPRFNSGNPMITVRIKDKDEAAYFMLNFDIK